MAAHIVNVKLDPIQVDLHVHVTGDGTEAVKAFLAGLERWIADNPGMLAKITAHPSQERGTIHTTVDGLKMRQGVPSRDTKGTDNG
jgi:hypothetical protein